MRRYLWKGVAFVLFAIVALAIAGGVVMGLWNWVVPSTFGWHSIGFWQALGLLILSKLLFGGFHRGGGSRHWRRRMAERWERMDPEERERLREHFREWCTRGGKSADSAVV